MTVPLWAAIAANVATGVAAWVWAHADKRARAGHLAARLAEEDRARRPAGVPGQALAPNAPVPPRGGGEAPPPKVRRPQ